MHLDISNFNMVLSKSYRIEVYFTDYRTDVYKDGMWYLLSNTITELSNLKFEYTKPNTERPPLISSKEKDDKKIIYVKKRNYDIIN